MRTAYPDTAPGTVPARSETLFDPFGEPVAEPAARAASAGGRTLRVGAAVFWGLVLAILAGRVYTADLPVTETVAAYAARIVALL